MIAQFGYATLIGMAIGVALCAMTNSPVTTLVDAWGSYKWGRLCFGVVAGLFAGMGSVVIGGAILGLGFALSANAARLNQKDKD